MPDLEAGLATQVIVKALRQVIRLVKSVLFLVDVDHNSRLSHRGLSHTAHAFSLFQPKDCTA